MDTNAATPQDAAPGPSLDDKILAIAIGDSPKPAEQQNEAPSEEALADDLPPLEEEVPTEEVEQPQVDPEDFELTHKGQQVKVTKEKARMLAQQGYDYSENMARLKQDYQRVQSMATAAQAQATIHPQVLDALAQAKAYELQARAFANVDWVKAAQEDPIGVVQNRQVYDQLLNGYHAAMEHAQQLDGQSKAAQRHVNEQQLALEGGELLKHVPEWKDQARLQKDTEGIFRTLASDYGFAKQELDGNPLFNDHRVARICRDAWMYRQALAKQKSMKNGQNKAPPFVKPGTPKGAPNKGEVMAELKRGLHQAKTTESRKAYEDRLIAAKFGIK